MQALVLESLGQAVRSAAFPVPGALVIQEGGFILLCGMFGIGAETSLALSLVKRVPDLVLGVPGLLGWQLLEGNRLLTRTRIRHLVLTLSVRSGWEPVTRSSRLNDAGAPRSVRSF